MSERICRVVAEAKRLGVLGPQLVAQVLRVGLAEAEALLASMESAGLVERLRGTGGCPCSRCPLARVCPWSRGGGARQAVLYRLTEKARRACRDP